MRETAGTAIDTLNRSLILLLIHICRLSVIIVACDAMFLLESIHFLAECQDLLRKVIEPSPELRIRLLEMEVHAWLTNNAKLPFFPFQAFPRDKAMRNQVAK